MVMIINEKTLSIVPHLAYVKWEEGLYVLFLGIGMVELESIMGKPWYGMIINEKCCMDHWAIRMCFVFLVKREDGLHVWLLLNGKHNGLLNK